MSTVSPAHISTRLRQLIQSTPVDTALFFARLWSTIAAEQDPETAHEALHTLALAFLAAGQPYSGLHLVRDHADDGRSAVQGQGRLQGCGGCAVIMARCCEKVGRYSEGQAVLERAVRRGMDLGKCLVARAESPHRDSLLISLKAVPQVCSTESAAASSLLLAGMSQKGKSTEVAIEQYTKALAEDPWLWEAFVGLCDLAEQIFPDPPTKTRPTHSRSPRPGSSAAAMPSMPMPRSSASEDPSLAPRRRQSPLSNGFGSHGLFTPDPATAAGGPAAGRMGMMGGGGAAGGAGGARPWETPSFAGDSTFPGITPAPSLPVAGHAPRRPISNLMSASSSSASSRPTASLRSSQASSSQASSTPMITPSSSLDSAAAPKPPPAMKRPRAQMSQVTRRQDPIPSMAMRGLEIKPGGREMRGIEPNGENTSANDALVRRSTRLKPGPGPGPTKVPKGDQRSVRSKSTTSSQSGSIAGATVSPANQEIALQAAADDWLRDVLRRCGKAYAALSAYRCSEALEEVEHLPTVVKWGAFPKEIAAKAYYEMANYHSAKAAFTALFTLEPYRLASSELYSTTLYHLCDTTALSYLSQTLMSIDRTTAPHAWIASGNISSLQRDHDEAMRCFKRATQVDPECAYAWTLCGYEASEMEEFERAIVFFRSAIRTDARHYNAWYGMGLVYLRQGKPKYAEHHFRRAAEINPTNPILLCCIGQVLEHLKDTLGALAVYEEAIKYAHNTPMVMFKYVRMLVSLHRIDEAVPRLELLARQAPDEAQVQFLLAKCYLRTGRRAEATACFTYARELQPKLEGKIKRVLNVAGRGARGEGGDSDDDSEDDDDEGEGDDDRDGDAHMQ